MICTCSCSGRLGSHFHAGRGRSGASASTTSRRRRPTTRSSPSLERLDDYRGESRFTTWAWKFAFYEACAAVRRRSWLRREVPVEAEGWEALGHEAGPDVATEQAELLAALKSAADEVLTPHQRSVFVALALALNEVPVDVLAERLGTKRGALYKTLHDARGRLRRALAAAGLGPPAWQITSRVQVT